jgi:hypothetical protein
MNIPSIGASSAWQTEITFSSSGAQLSAMVVEAEGDAAARTDQALEANQQRIARAAEAEYQAAMRAADAAGREAWWSGAFTVAGGVAVMGSGAIDAPSGSSETAQLLAQGGGILSNLSDEAGALGGGIAKLRHEAEGRRIGRSIEQANVESDQLAQQSRRSGQRAEAALDRASSLVEAENARASGVLSNF